MSKGLAITALILAIVGFGVPVITVIWVCLTIIIAAIALLTGNEGKGIAIAAWLVSIVNLLLLSPLFWAAVAGEAVDGGNYIIVVTFAVFTLPIVALVMRARKKKVVSVVDSEVG